MFRSDSAGYARSVCCLCQITHYKYRRVYTIFFYIAQPLVLGGSLYDTWALIGLCWIGKRNPSTDILFSLGVFIILLPPYSTSNAIRPNKHLHFTPTCIIPPRLLLPYCYTSLCPTPTPTTTPTTCIFSQCLSTYKHAYRPIIVHIVGRTKKGVVV